MRPLILLYFRRLSVEGDHASEDVHVFKTPLEALQNICVWNLSAGWSFVPIGLEIDGVVHGRKMERKGDA